MPSISTAYVPEEPGLRSSVRVLAPKLNTIKTKPPAFQGMRIPESLSMVDADQLNPVNSKRQAADLIDQETLKPINKILTPAKQIASAAIESSKGIGTDVTTVGYGMVKKLLQEDSKTMNQIRTWLFGIGGLASGVLGLKSFTRFGKNIYGDRKYDFSPLADLVDGVLTMGLAGGLLAPFIGIKSPFRKVINGVVTASPMRLVGSLAAVLGFKSLTGSAKGTSIFNKLFNIIGIDLKEAIRPFFDGVNWLTTDDQPNRNAPPGGGGGPPAGLGGFPGR